MEEEKRLLEVEFLKSDIRACQVTCRVVQQSPTNPKCCHMQAGAWEAVTSEVLWLLLMLVLVLVHPREWRLQIVLSLHSLLSLILLASCLPMAFDVRIPYACTFPRSR
jgi:hypothetical protein